MMSKVLSKFSIGDVVSYSEEKRGSRGSLVNTCYARILAIKIDDKDLYYKMSDRPYSLNSNGDPECWVNEQNVMEEYIVKQNNTKGEQT